jgi:hypothetical protein
MGIKKHIECYNCDAVFKITHDLDADYYQLTVCPFCASDLEEEESFDQEDEDEE